MYSYVLMHLFQVHFCVALVNISEYPALVNDAGPAAGVGACAGDLPNAAASARQPAAEAQPAGGHPGAVRRGEGTN